ncbi:MAG: 3-oxoacyl-ACP synthase [Bacteroidota bacterium]
MELIVTSYCEIHEKKVVINDRLAFFKENFLNFADFLKSVYKQEEINYPKFYKMDSVSKLGFLATELVLKEKSITGYRNDAVGVVLSNSSSSLDTDILHNDTIKDRTNYFPSPSVFVYTLPNIVIGEICIKNKINGENVFLVSETFDGKLLVDYVSELFLRSRLDACLCGWVEVLGNKYKALIMLVEKGSFEGNEIPQGFVPIPFTISNLNQLIVRN